MPHETHEALRKSLHIAFGLFAFTLRVLPWPVAAGVAFCAILGNWLVLHRIVGSRVARHERGYDAGIVIYPAAVFVLIIVFRHRIEIAGVAWAILAFGDGFATLAGKTIRGPRLPWNPDKTWSGLAAFAAFGFIGAEVIYLWLRSRPAALSTFALIGITVSVAAVCESLPLHVDDNITVPLASAVTMTLLLAIEHPPVMSVSGGTMIWLGANTVLAIVGFAMRSVDVSGLIGGWILGAIVILFGGWPLYTALLAFFVIGSAATKAGYRRKAERGLAQEGGGRRGAAHAFSNVGVAAILAIVAATSSHASAFWFAAAASLATAAADTTASEVGQLIGRRAFLPLTFRRVPAGTEGAISVEGTVAGLIAGAAVAIVTSLAAFGRLEPHIILYVTAAAFIGSYVESVAGSWNRTRRQSIPNGALNFFNTAVGASVLLAIVFARRLL